MSTRVLLNLLKELRKSDKKIKGTGARMLDSFY